MRVRGGKPKRINCVETLERRDELRAGGGISSDGKLDPRRDEGILRDRLPKLSRLYLPSISEASSWPPSPRDVLAVLQ